jgi:chromosome partitioning protein
VPIVIAIVNQKGGCGKTTTTVNLAGALARANYAMTVVDCDAQANSSRALGNLPPASISPNLFELLVTPRTSTAEVVHDSRIPGISLIYSHIRVSRVDNLIRGQLEKFREPMRLLQAKFAASAPPGEFTLLDCPPSLSLVTFNALTAADYYIIPVESGSTYSLDGLDDLIETIGDARMQNQRLRPLGVLITKHDERQTINRSMRKVMRASSPALKCSRRRSGRRRPSDKPRANGSPCRRGIAAPWCRTISRTWPARSVSASTFHSQVGELLQTVDVPCRRRTLNPDLPDGEPFNRDAIGLPPVAERPFAPGKANAHSNCTLGQAKGGVRVLALRRC